MSAIQPEEIARVFSIGGDRGTPMRALDWSQTSLGAVETWSQTLKTTLNILFQTNCPMLLVWGGDRLLFYNDAYSALAIEGDFHLPLGQPINGNTPPAWRAVYSEIEQVFATGQSVQRQNQPFPSDRDSDPEAPLYNWSYTALWDEVGRVGGVLATGNRVIPPATPTPTERDADSSTQEQWQQREEQLRLIINAFPVLIAYIDKDGYYRFNNQTYETWFGQPVATFMNRHVRDVLGETTYEALRPYRDKALSGQVVSYESQISDRDGGTRYIKADYIPHLNARGEVEGYFSLVSDVSERKRAEEERQQTEQSLRRSEERFRLVTNAVKGLVFDWDLRTHEVYRSEKLYDLVGIRPEEAPLNATWWNERVHPDDRTRLQPQIAELFASSNHLYEVEYRILHQDGRWVDVWEQGCLVRDERGAVVRIVGSTMDISDRKQAEGALREQEQQLQQLSDSMPQFVWICNPAGEAEYINQQWLEFSGLTLEQTRDRSLMEQLYHPDDRQTVFERWAIALETQQTFEVEARLKRASDGEYRWFLIRAVPGFTDGGEVLHWYGTSTDIHDRKRIEEALRTSEERLRFTVEGAALGTWEYDLSSSQIIWSDRAKVMFGVPPDAEVDYQVFMNALHPDDRERIHDAVERAIAQQELYDVELRSVWADGSVRWIRSIGRARYDSNGIPTRMIGVVLDITNRKQAEDDLRESERRFRRLVESNLFGVAFSDFTGRIQKANDYFLNLLGYTREEIETEDLQGTEIASTNFLSLDEKTRLELRTKGVATPFEKEYQRKDGSRVPILIGLALLQEPYDRQQETIAFFIDLTERKQAEAERERLLQQTQVAREEAETANRIKDEFLAVLSHELRSPLNPILGWSKLLQTRRFDELGTQRALQTIERNAKLQTQLIDDLLDVSRILRGKMALNIGPVNLVTAIESALETVRLAAEAKQIQMQTVISCDRAPLLGDSARLQQIIWNLLSNAIKFTPDGGQVKIRLNLMGSYAQIEVQDTGKGINSDFLPYVFDYFRQEDGKTTRKFGGLGLGLAIVRHLTELHGGTVRAESPGEGQGATFTVRLPLISDGVRSKQKRSIRPQSPNLSQLRVLVVDDHEDMRQLVQTILEQLDAQVRVAASAAEALTMFDRQVPDILISDIGMPEVDGYSLIQQIRRRSPDRGGLVKAIALTAYAGESNHQQALQAGFQKHLPKPIEPEALINAVSQLISTPKSTRFSSP